MAVKSQISAIVSTQIGKLQGELEAKIQEQAFELVSKFANQCPAPEELLKIAKTVNNLLTIINGFTKKVDKFSKIPNTLSPAIRASKVLITLLKNNPTPSAIIPPSGGVGIPIGRLVTLSDRLRSVNQLLEALEDDVESLRNITQSITPTIEQIKQTLSTVNISIEQCIKEIQEAEPDSEQVAEEIQAILREIQPPENTGTEGTPDDSYLYLGPDGKEYKLSIIQDIREDSVLPRRVAIARDNRGIIVLRGQPSFSSNTQVLLDELKFRIDRQLP